jgi:hypothetical protein
MRKADIKKALQVVETYLTRNGSDCEILAQDFEGIAFVISEGDEIAFIDVCVGVNGELPETQKSRRDFEHSAMKYLFMNDLPSTTVRFDEISICPQETKSFIRHHRDALSSDKS